MQQGLGSMLQEQLSMREKQALNRQLLQSQIDEQRARSAQYANPNYLRSQQPSAVQEYQFYQGLSPEEQQRYLSVKRSTPEEALMRKGVTIDPTTGQAMPLGGFGRALGSIEAEKEKAQRQANKSKARNALLNFERNVERNVKSIDKAINLISPYSSGYGSMLSALPNTDARALNNLLTEIKARVGFDNLQQMRDNSPTGGALGAVSEMENKLLQAVEGTLDPGQPDQLRENLKIIKDLYPQVLAEKKYAYENDYNKQQAPQEESIPTGGSITPQQNELDAKLRAKGFTPEQIQEYKRLKGL